LAACVSSVLPTPTAAMLILEQLKNALQAELATASVAHPTFAMGLGWHSEVGSFGLAAGPVPATIDAPSRPARPDDRFLFGSGTKPLTATAVLRLKEAGVLSLDDPAAKHVDAVLAAANGTSMVELFGTEAARVTVGQLLRMQSGLPDFDVPSLDQTILQKGDLKWPPYAVLRAASSYANRTLHFPPGSRVEYSSTNYVVAGLVLLRHQPAARGDWARLDLASLVFPPPLRAAYAKVQFVNDAPISSVATVPGISGMVANRTTQIWGQRGGVLGWTCGNMVSSARLVANFYHDLLVAKRLLSPRSLQTMQQFHVLNYGWAAGHIEYGAGLMIEQSSYHNGRPSAPPNFSQWGAYMGHGGDTYGFLSEQGIIGQLGNASFSVVSNQDADGRFVQGSLACRVISAAAKVLANKTLHLDCYL